MILLFQSKAGSEAAVYYTRAQDVQETTSNKNRSEETNFCRRTIATT